MTIFDEIAKIVNNKKVGIEDIAEQIEEGVETISNPVVLATQLLAEKRANALKEGLDEKKD